MRILPILAAGVLALGATGAWSRAQVEKGYEMPTDEPVKVIVMRPDVSVGVVHAGGLEEPNADWTTKSRGNLASALTSSLRAKGDDVGDMPEAAGDDAKTVDAYQKLYRAVANAIYLHKYAIGGGLPTKKGKFDWSLGPGAARLAAVSGGSHALFIYTHDAFSASDRKALQIAGLAGCAVGFCVIVPSGLHFYYASLVDLKTGDVVWFNYMPSSHGDIRNREGAQQMVDDLLATLPRRHDPAAAAKK